MELVTYIKIEKIKAVEVTEANVFELADFFGGDLLVWPFDYSLKINGYYCYFMVGDFLYKKDGKLKALKNLDGYTKE